MILCPLKPFRNRLAVGWVESWSVQVEQCDHSDDARSAQVQLGLFRTVFDHFSPTVETHRLDSHLLGQIGVQPPAQKIRQSSLFCPTFAKEHKPHDASASSSPLLCSAPSEYSFSQTASSSPPMVLSCVSPSVHFSTVVVGTVVPKASRNWGE